MEIITNYEGPPLPPERNDENKNRHISDRPIYCKQKTISIAENECSTVVQSVKASEDTQRLGMDLDDLMKTIVNSLSKEKNHRFIRAEWCDFYNCWAASDAYRFKKNHNNSDDDFYFKYFLIDDELNINNVSFHL